MFGSVPWSDFAMQVGIGDIDQFDACVKDAKPLERIELSVKLAEQIGIRGTPTIIVNGWKLPMPPSLQQFDMIVKNVMDGKRPTADLEFRS
jgi:protein-disulfide isomerase